MATAAQASRVEVRAAVSLSLCEERPDPVRGGTEVQPQESRQWREWTALHTSLVRTYHDLPVLLPRTHL